MVIIMDRGIIVLCNYVKRKYVISGHYLPALSLRPLGSPDGINCMEYITYNKQYIPLFTDSPVTL